jgi:hypothetical protein
MYLDEYDNDALREAIASGEFAAGSTPALRAEATRVDGVIANLVTTGVDLAYWIERGNILRSAAGA